MGFFDLLISMRRKPVTARRHFAAVVAIVVMGSVTLVWFIFFFAGLPERLKTSSPESATSTPQSIPESLSSPF